MTWRTLLTLLSVRNGKRLADGIRGAKDAGRSARQQLEFTSVLHGSCLSRRSFLFGVAQKNVLNNLWAAPLLVLYRIITECFFGYEIQPPRP